MVCACGKLEEQVLDRYAESLQNVYRKLGHRFKFLDPYIDGLRDTYRTPQEITYNILLKWRNENIREHCQCALMAIIRDMDRDDAISQEAPEALVHARETPSMSTLPKPQASHAPMRPNECQRIVEFADFEHNEKKLLTCIGIPGIGKKELIYQALEKVHTASKEIDIVVPRLCSNMESHTCTLPEIAQNILQGFNVSANKDDCPTLLEKTLLNLKQPTILVLTLNMVTLSSGDFVRFWSCFHDVLSRDEKNNLKVLASCLRHPEFAHRGDVIIETIRLRELSMDLSIKLLQDNCPDISSRDAGRIYKCSGGIPVFLVKIGLFLGKFDRRKLSTEVEKLIQKLYYPNSLCQYVSTLFTNSRLQDGIQSLIHSLEKLELGALVQFVATCGSFQASDIRKMFGEQVDYMAEHLWSEHCILERCDNIYSINPVIHCLLKNVLSDDKMWCRQLQCAERTYSSYVLDLIMHSGRYVFGEKHLPQCLWEQMTQLRLDCHICSKESYDPIIPLTPESTSSSPDDSIDGVLILSPGENNFTCTCGDYTLICRIFKVHEKTFLYVLKRGAELDELHLQKTFETVIYTLPLLWKVLKHNDLFNLLDLYFNVSYETEDELAIAAVQSSIVYLHLLYNGSHGPYVDMHLQILKHAYVVFDRNKHCLSETYRECRARISLKLGSLIVSAYGDPDYGIQMMEEGLEIRKRMHCPDILLAGAYIELSMVYLDQKNYDLAKSFITKAIEIFRGFGSHPFAAESFRQLGDICLSQDQVEAAIKQYKLALSLDRKLLQKHGETIRSLSSLGKAHVQLGKRGKGFQYLQEAIDMGGNLTEASGDELQDTCGAMPEELTKACDDWIIACCASDPETQVSEKEKTKVGEKAALLRSKMRYTQHQRKLSKYARILGPNCELRRYGRDNYTKFVVLFMIGTVAVHFLDLAYHSVCHCYSDSDPDFWMTILQRVSDTFSLSEYFLRG